MASWAVPKGPSYDPAVRRLAVQTEDHPMAYNAFEGRIPDGEYGAGDVLIWDRGTYETVPPGQSRAMMTKGHLHIRLFGEKLKGDWHLIRTGGRGGDDGTGESGKAQWLMFKAKDALADPGFDVVAERPESVVSGRVATRGPRRVGASEKGASAHKLFDAVGQPLLAKLVEHVADEDEWLFEVKYDGYRIVASKAGPDVRLYTRSGLDWTDRFRPIADGVGRLKARECVIDGEACVVDEKGRPSFAALQQWLSKVLAFSRDKSPPPKGPIALGYVAFDLLWLDGRDLRTEPIEARRELLERLLDGQGAPLSFSRTVNGSVDELLKAAKASGLEGLVGKRKGSIYSPGRTGVWIKLRFDRTQDCVIAGWAPLANTADQVGALLLAVAEQGKLVYAGRVGTGFDTQSRRELRAKLARLKRSDPGVESAPRDQGVHWVEPTLVCECEFKEWTSDGSMRHPRYVRLREDKAPLECVRRRTSRPLPGHPSRDSQACESRQGPLSSRRHHQKRRLGLLLGGRPGHAAPSCRAAAHFAALPERHRWRRVVPAKCPRQDAALRSSSRSGTASRREETNRLRHGRDAPVAREPRRIDAPPVDEPCPGVDDVPSRHRPGSVVARLRGPRSRSGRRSMDASGRSGPRRKDLA
jgi:bifunctional non-homologous end joining protein LigD